MYHYIYSIFSFITNNVCLSISSHIVISCIINDLIRVAIHQHQIGDTLNQRIKHNTLAKLTLILPIATMVPYANSLDPDETLSNSVLHLDQIRLTLRLHFTNFERLCSTMKIVADEKFSRHFHGRIMV